MVVYTASSRQAAGKVSAWQAQSLVRQDVGLYHCLPCRHSPNIRGKIFFKQFRQIMKLHWPEFKRGRRKTDLCDHCECFRKKIIPRTREFLQRAKRDLEEVCPGHTRPALPEWFYVQTLRLRLVCTQQIDSFCQSSTGVGPLRSAKEFQPLT